MAIGRTQAFLASVYRKQRRFDLAIRLFQRATVNLEKTTGPEHPFMAEVYPLFADALRKAGRPAEAASMRSKPRPWRAASARGATDGPPPPILPDVPALS